MKSFFSLAKYPKLYFAFVGLGAIVNLKFRILNTYYILYRTNVKYCTSNSENLFLLQGQLFKSKVLKLSRNPFRKSQPQTKINIWKLKQNTISVSHSFISTFFPFEKFSTKTIFKISSWRLFAEFVFCEMPSDQMPCNCREHEILHQIMPGQQIPSFA